MARCGASCGPKAGIWRTSWRSRGMRGSPSSVMSHTSAAVLWGLPLFRTNPRRVHMTTPHPGADLQRARRAAALPRPRRGRGHRAETASAARRSSAQSFDLARSMSPRGGGERSGCRAPDASRSAATSRTRMRPAVGARRSGRWLAGASAGRAASGKHDESSSSQTVARSCPARASAGCTWFVSASRRRGCRSRCRTGAAGPTGSTSRSTMSARSGSSTARANTSTNRCAPVAPSSRSCSRRRPARTGSGARRSDASRGGVTSTSAPSAPSAPARRFRHPPARRA